ncbi:serine hydrolase domain-containing protein [Streptomyces sp. 4N509B]|uniref:serine hydrolase domain-containing protein n=1 Tax=Streptomyces sp. 4N509B TaxID=3457413 RepID=UPI003FD03E7C
MTRTTDGFDGPDDFDRRDDPREPRRGSAHASGPFDGLVDGWEDLPLLSGTRRALAHRVAVEQAGGRTPSVVAGVVRHGRLVWRGGRGELPGAADAVDAPDAVDGPDAVDVRDVADAPDVADVQYRIGSITKTLTALLVMRLRDEGLIDLGDPLGAHLSTPHAGDATIAQLLSHASGLAAEPRGPWWERTPGTLRPELADLFGEPPHETPRKHPTGRRHHYSNVGYALLGALVERKRDAPWATALREEVLEPLGMRRTTFLPVAPHATGWAVHPLAELRQPEPAADTGLMAPAGQLWSTVADLARLAAFLLAGDERVLGAASLAEMRTPAVPPEPGAWESSYGLGLQLWQRGERLLVGHGGSMPGFLAGLWTSPGEGLAAVALTNATSGPFTGALAADLVAEVAAREPALPEPWRPMPEAEVDQELLALTGPWYWGTHGYELRLRSGRELSLVSATGAATGRCSRFVPRAVADGGGWIGQDGYFAGEVLRVVRRRDGSDAVSHLDLGTFVLTRRPYDPEADGVPGGVDPAGWRA